MQMKFDKTLVDRFLSINHHNRRLSPSHVLALARNMREGNFFSNNGQTIVVNESMTRLLDGQHRLMAIKEADYPVYDFEVVVVPDKDAEKIFQTIDIGATGRNIGTILSLQGVKNAMAVKSIVSALCEFSLKKYSLSVEEVKTILSKYAREIELLQYTRALHLTNRCPPASFWAGCLNAMLLRPENEHAIVLSLGRIIENKCTTRSEQALVSFLIGNVDPRKKISRRYMFFITTKAMLNQNIRCLKIQDDESLEKYCLVSR